MDPISLGIMAVGMGMQIYGGISQSNTAHKVAGVNKDVANQEQAINDAKARQMELEARRTQVENVRNSQRARAMGVQAATSQGAQFGTGLQGGLAQVHDKMAWNMLGVDQALSTGRDINKLNNNISDDKRQLADLGADSATAQGISSLGGAVLKAGPIVGQMGQGFGGSSNIGTFDSNNWGAAPTWKNYG